MSPNVGLFGRPDVGEVLDAVTELAALLPFFPQDAFALKLLAEHVHEFIGTREQLDWFRRKAGGSLTKYDGVPALRALFCIKYAPFDGVLPIVECPGFEEDQLEAAFRQRELEENERRLQKYRREALLAPPEDREPFLLPEPPPMPEVPKQITAAASTLSAAAQIDQVEAGIRCQFCADGRRRVKSARTGSYIHPETECGLVPCKNRGPREGDEIETLPPQTPPVDGDASRTLDGGAAS
jgi:hypothetical protein